MDRLQPVRPVTVFDSVFDQLSALLASDTFAPGERLPSERQLAGQLHVSRPSVREALKVLRVLGLIEVQGRATYVKSAGVKSPGSGSVAAPLPVAEVELLEIQEFREAIESQIAGLAAERAVAQDASTLEQVFGVMEQEVSRDVGAFLAADRAFHRTLAHVAGNRLLMAAHSQIHDHALRQPRLQSALRQVATTEALAQTLEAYRLILEAVRQRDREKARQVMRDHLARMRQFISVEGLGQTRLDGGSADGRVDTNHHADPG